MRHGIVAGDNRKKKYPINFNRREAALSKLPDGSDSPIWIFDAGCSEGRLVEHQSASFIINSGSQRAIWGKSIMRAIPMIKTPMNGKTDL